MTEIVTNTANLPANIEDLSKFVLVGREKLIAVRAEIRAIQKVGLAKEVYDQKLKEAQEVAEAVLDAETRMGELIKDIPKAKENQYTKVPIDNTVEKQKPKSEVLHDAGIPQKQAERFQTLAAFPQAVAEAKAEAREEGRIVTRQDVLNKVTADYRKPDLKKWQQEQVDKAKKAHEEFQEQKETDSVVAMSDIRKDKENQKVIAHDLYKRCRDMGKKIFDLYVDINEGFVDLSIMYANITEEEKNGLLQDFALWNGVLKKIAQGVSN